MRTCLPSCCPCVIAGKHGLTWLRPLLGSERQSLAIFNVHPMLPQPESPLLAQSHLTQLCCPEPQLPRVCAEVYTVERHFRFLIGERGRLASAMVGLLPPPPPLLLVSTSSSYGGCASPYVWNA